MSGLQNKLVEDWKEAMKAKNKKKDVLSLMITEMKNRAIKDNLGAGDQRVVSDEIGLEVLTRMAKQRTESIDSYKAANRLDLVDKETFELEVIKSYLPTPISEGEVLVLINEAVIQTGATSKKDLGKVMGKVLPQVKGRVDGKLVQNWVMEALERFDTKSS